MTDFCLWAPPTPNGVIGETEVSGGFFLVSLTYDPYSFIARRSCLVYEGATFRIFNIRYHLIGIKSGYGTRLIPDGTIQGAHFVQTPDYVQITGK